ncbi:hypothetical protein M409DRAFT_66830 [Zasmidium cellare ATCC 36951]|uniref:Uncharacterized protein n=1 Tax=Zasmidium cellare ATCC 36951 TaxID=1080233 RepID=A0A6A6CJL8_ZASCE|nr:uncharacterized protein M409DRAFT_66830 [Zasmidium cellare ATCC 36951]KAF2166388.1 hypothetical protein M409DRAFT_66830 [Zasmidium cellare ATCC 36951]
MPLPGISVGRWNALIRTHHITSRKKVAKLRQAAATEDVYALLHSGRPPGIMYVEGTQAGVESWVATVQRLRYKDFQLASRPSVVERGANVVDEDGNHRQPGLFEVSAVKDFAADMEKRQVYAWWRKAMGFTGSEDRL